jgi:hypothetical protein
MRVGVIFLPSQVTSKVTRLKAMLRIAAVILFVLFGGCARSSDDTAVVPPPTPPLSRPIIGYGVISSSYTHMVAEPESGGVSRGYLRKGSIVPVLERRSVNIQGTVESWVLVGGDYQGWLREDVVQVYDNESQARTAVESLNQ